ncbi:PaaI family thioesterase [Sphingomonas cavernae]|uniref:PaaI family thioesterase n=1 Tax=Sphingomonas cavernae TaxID=2320861 RepID=A0A418W7G0_9SPHN|nr:PaaI family thioesterase [Sphingomonas cavernae]RJF85908.1 PaaI family thioesterase [Sphingomonas cavernae]
MKTLPPYAQTLGLSIADTEGGVPVLAMAFSDDVLGRPGFIHGGALGGMLEMAAIMALHCEFAEDEKPRFKPINITVDFMRGGRDKETRAIGAVTRVGTRIANVEAIAWQDDREKPIAAARMNILIERG